MQNLIFPIIATIAAWVLGALFTKMLIPFLEKKQFRQFVREEGPQSHLSKTGTPSMGGLAIINAAAISAIVVTAVEGSLDIRVVGVIVLMYLFSLIGFIDDYEKAKGALIGISKSTMGFEGLCRSDNLEALSGLDIATEIPSLSQISVGLMKEHTTLAGLF